MKAIRDRSEESLELRALADPSEWFILNIVMSVVLDESKLTKDVTIEEQMRFVETHLNDLMELFDGDNYPCAKLRLKDLARNRGKLLFPDWH